MSQPNIPYIFSEFSPQQAVWHMLDGFRITQSIYVVAKLGVADLLQDGPKHCDDLATQTGIRSDLLYRLLRALASVGIFAETESRCFKLTPRAICLQSDTVDSLRNLAILKGDLIYPVFGQMLQSLQTGQSGFQLLHGMELYDYWQTNPEAAKILNEGITNISATENEIILGTYDFSSLGTIVDIAGGEGSLLAKILHKHPNMKGILFEQPHLIEIGKQLLTETGVIERCEFQGGNCFASVPEGGDAYLVKHVFQNWQDEQVIAVLQNCYKAMKDSAKLLVIEAVIPLGNTPFKQKFRDLSLFVFAPNGKERTEQEWKDVFKAGGFELTAIIPTELELSIIEGQKK